MKKIIAILRHGEAESALAYTAASDKVRVLTALGRQQSTAAAATLMQSFQHDDIDAIFYSPYKRTEQTAQLVVDTLASAGKNNFFHDATDELLGNNVVGNVGRWIEQLPYKNIVLISHQPLVSNLMHWLIDGDRSGQGYSFYPSSLGIIQGEVIERGCTKFVALVHHPANPA